MPEVLDLGMDDEEYLQLLAQGRDPVQEYFCKMKLVRAGVPNEDIEHILPLLMSQSLSNDEEKVVQKFWQIVLD